MMSLQELEKLREERGLEIVNNNKNHIRRVNASSYSVLFENGFPLVVFEYKFSRSKRAYPSHHVQAGFYGILLKNIGFNVEKLYYAIVVADRRAKGDPTLKERVFDALQKNGLKNAVIPIENAVIYLNKFDQQGG